MSRGPGAEATMTDPTALHRAPADPRRAELVTALEEALGALDASELGRRVGLHANTVRWHLGILEDAGVVTSHAERRDTPGRPRRVWERAPDGVRDAEDAHSALAEALVSVVAGLPTAEADAEAAGRAWGTRAADGAVGEETAEGAVGALVRLLAERGFEPRRDGLEVSMHRCPYADLARRSPGVVCGMHRGLVEGVLDGVGSALEVDELEVFAQPGVCVLRLRRGRARPPDRASGTP